MLHGVFLSKDLKIWLNRTILNEKFRCHPQIQSNDGTQRKLRHPDFINNSTTSFYCNPFDRRLTKLPSLSITPVYFHIFNNMLNYFHMHHIIEIFPKYWKLKMINNTWLPTVMTRRRRRRRYRKILHLIYNRE